ncbi:MAG: CHAD domain-containing protein [Bryobacteraceae bacterium]
MKLESHVETFFSAGREAVRSKDPKELHAFRIAAKRLRYTIEILDPKGGSEWLKRLRVVQGQLGRMNDAVVAEQYLRALPTRSIRARPLPAKLRAEARAHIAAFQGTWRRRFGPRTEKAWLTWARAVEQ